MAKRYGESNKVVEAISSHHNEAQVNSLKAIYREILSASLSLEEPLKVSCLGPLATFTHLAALRHFGSSAVFVPVDSIRMVFEKVETGKADYGVVDDLFNVVPALIDEIKKVKG